MNFQSNSKLNSIRVARRLVSKLHLCPLVAVIGWSLLTATSANAAIIIESRPGGLNYAMYSETPSTTDVHWADNPNKSTALGLTPGVGSRSVSTFLEGVGEQHAIFAPNLPDTGLYEVFVTWGPISSRRNPILYEVTHAGGVTQVDIDQSADPNEWVSLGTFVFTSGVGGMVDMSNLHVNTFGNMLADAVKWELLEVINVPEPASLPLLSTLLALFSRRRFSRR